MDLDEEQEKTVDRISAAWWTQARRGVRLQWRGTGGGRVLDAATGWPISECTCGALAVGAGTTGHLLANPDHRMEVVRL